MKSLIANICVSILRKLQVSTVIGCKIEGKITLLNKDGWMCDSYVILANVNEDQEEAE